MVRLDAGSRVLLRQTGRLGHVGGGYFSVVQHALA